MRRLLALAAAMAMAAASGPARAGTALPSMTREGPYGDPLQLRPALLPDIQDARAALAIGDVAFAVGREGNLDRASLDPTLTGRTGTVAGRAGTVAGRAGSTAGVSLPHGEDDLPAATPGTFKSVPTKLPGVLLKTKTVTHHLTPDVEVALSPRTSVGLFGEVGKVEFEQGTGLLPSVRARDLGAGVSFQYRLGP